MPRHSRTASGSHSTSHRVHSYNNANQAAQLYATQRLPSSYYTIPSQPLSQSQPVYNSFDSQAPASPVATSSSAPEKPSSANRSGSVAWSPADDAKLISARTAGLNWSQIRESYFPTKSPNACRKRHERLMDRKTTATDWDVRKMNHLAKEYMNMRKEIWQPLAQRTGEKWNVVEQKCMSNGLKNLQSAARSANRLERFEQASDYHSANASHPGYDDDSGVSGIGLTPVDETEQYSSPEECVSVNQSFATVTGGGMPSYSQHHTVQYAQHRQQQPQISAQLQPLNVQYSMQPAYTPTQYAPVHQHRYSSSASSNASLSHPFVSRGGHGSSQGSSPYMDEQRLV